MPCTPCSWLVRSTFGSHVTVEFTSKWRFQPPLIVSYSPQERTHFTVGGLVLRPGCNLLGKLKTRFLQITITDIIVSGNIGLSASRWRLPVDFDDAAKLAERIGRGENGKLRQQLIDMCIPYFLGIRFRFGLRDISYEDVTEELTSDAINDVMFIMRDSRSAFGIRLQNAFRKCCRERSRQKRRLTARELAEKCDSSYLPGITGSRPPANPGAEQNESIELIRHELETHAKASKTAIYERMRGSSYQEIAMILGKDAHRSRALFWDNLKQIRKNLRIGKTKDQDASQAV